MRLTAKRLVLELLTANDSHQGSVARLVDAGDILGVDANSIRVALARLVAAGTLKLAARGEYRLASTTRALTEQVTGWRDLERQVRRWTAAGRPSTSAMPRAAIAVPSGGASAPCGCSDFASSASHSRCAPTTWPAGSRRCADSSSRSVSTSRHSCTARPSSTMQPSGVLAPCSMARSSTPHTVRPPRGIRPVPRRAGRSSAARRVRESFVFGSDVLRAIMFDPRLPQPLVDDT